MKRTIARFANDYIDKNAPGWVKGILGKRAVKILASFALDLFKLFHKEDYQNLQKIIGHLPTAEGVNTSEQFIQRVCKTKKMQYTAEGEEFLDPATPGIIVANHPTGALDGIILLRYLHDRGIKAKIVMNSINSFMDSTGDIILPVCNKKHFDREVFYDAVRKAIDDGYFVIIFPAGNEAVYNRTSGQLEELPRTGLAAVTLSSMYKIPLYPVHIHVPAASIPDNVKHKKRGVDALTIFIRSLVEETFFNGMTLQWRKSIGSMESVFDKNGEFVKQKAKKLSDHVRSTALEGIESKVLTQDSEMFCEGK